MEELKNENTKIKVMGHRITQWRRISSTLNVFASRENLRITSRDIFGLAVIDTSDEAVAIIKVIEDKKVANTLLILKIRQKRRTIRRRIRPNILLMTPS